MTIPRTVGEPVRSSSMTIAVAGFSPPVPTMMRLVRRVSSPFLGGSWRASRRCPLTVSQASKASLSARPEPSGAVALSDGQGCVALIWIKDTSLVLGQVA